MSSNYRIESRKDWKSTFDQVSTEQINTGSLQRIADACELMAKNYGQMQSDLEYYKKRYAEQRASGERMAKRIAAYQGHINRMKKLIKTP